MFNTKKCTSQHDIIILLANRVMLSILCKVFLSRNMVRHTKKIVFHSDKIIIDFVMILFRMKKPLGIVLF